jgi:hypothetical protein
MFDELDAADGHHRIPAPREPRGADVSAADGRMGQ